MPAEVSPTFSATQETSETDRDQALQHLEELLDGPTKDMEIFLSIQEDATLRIFRIAIDHVLAGLTEETTALRKAKLFHARTSVAKREDDLNGFLSNREHALREAKKAVKEEGSVDAFLTLSCVAEIKGNVVFAIRELKKGMRKREIKEDPEVLNTYGRLHQKKAAARAEVMNFQQDFKAQDQAEAEREVAYEYFQKAREADPTLAKASFNLANLYEEDGSINVAIKIIERLTTVLYPAPQDVHFRLGQLLQQAGRHREAIEHFTEAAQGPDAFPRATTELINYAINQGDHQAALEHLQHYERLSGSPLPTELLHLKGTLLKTLGNLEEASIFFNIAASAPHSNVESKIQLAQIESLEGHSGRAIGSLEALLTPENKLYHGEIHYCLGLLHIERRVFDAAETHLHQATQCVPASLRAYLSHWGLRADQGDIDGAIALAEEFRARFPGQFSAPLLSNLGILYQKRAQKWKACFQNRYQELQQLNSRRREKEQQRDIPEEDSNRRLAEAYLQLVKHRITILHKASERKDQQDQQAKLGNIVERLEAGTTLPKGKLGKCYRNLLEAAKDCLTFPTGRLDDSKALQLFREATRRNPRLLQAQHNLGRAYRSMGRMTLAIKSYAKAIELGSTLSHLEIAQVYCNLPTPETTKALEHVEIYLQRCQEQGGDGTNSSENLQIGRQLKRELLESMAKADSSSITQ